MLRPLDITTNFRICKIAYATSLNFQRCYIDYKSALHIAFQHAFIGVIDILDLDHLISAVGRHLVTAVNMIIGKCRDLRAILFMPMLAGQALLTGIDHAADTYMIARLGTFDILSNACHAADDSGCV